MQKSGAVDFLFNREFTEKELSRYQDLEAAYHADEYFPERSIRRLEAGEEYAGVGVCIRITDSAVRTRLSRAREKLRRFYQEAER